MAIEYRVYANNYAGGAVDYTTPVATVSSPTYTPAAIPVNSDVTFAVRAFDTATSVEEHNITVRFRLRTGSGGEDLALRPSPVVRAWATPDGSSAVAVGWIPAVSGPKPTEYRVYGGTPTVSYATPLATVPYLDGIPALRVLVPGLTPGSSYAFDVLPKNASGTATQGSGACQATPVGATGPEAPPTLTASAGWPGPA